MKFDPIVISLLDTDLYKFNMNQVIFHKHTNLMGEYHFKCRNENVVFTKEMLDFYEIPLEGKRAVVIGRSLVIGKPVSMMLQQRNATVTMCHTRTKDMPAVCRDAEILIAAAGKAGVVGGEFVSQSQVIIDVGINVTPDGKLTGDVDFPEVEPKVAAISPVPAGVGSITTAVLWKHVVEAAEKRLNK